MEGPIKQRDNLKGLFKEGCTTSTEKNNQNLRSVKVVQKIENSKRYFPVSVTSTLLPETGEKYQIKMCHLVEKL